FLSFFTFNVYASTYCTAERQHKQARDWISLNPKHSVAQHSFRYLTGYMFRYNELSEGKYRGFTCERFITNKPDNCNFYDGPINDDGSCPKDKNYCSSGQFNHDKKTAEDQCISGIPDNHNMNFSAFCNAETASANFQCDYIPIDDCTGPGCNDSGDGDIDNGLPDGGGSDNGDGSGSGSGDGDIDLGPPDGGDSGNDGDSDNGSGEGGSGDGGVDGGLPDGGNNNAPDFCRDNPDVCLYPPDDPACIENPALCDVEPTDDIIAAIQQATAAIKDQHFNTNVAIKKNTQVSNNIANDILSSSEHVNKQIKTLIDTNMVSNDLAIEGNDLIENNTINVVKSINDGSGDIVDAVDKGTSELKGIKKEIVDFAQEMSKGFCERNKDHHSCQSKKSDITKCATFTCEGEPVFCNLLRIEHEKQCYKPNFKDIDSGIDSIIASGENAELLNPEILDFSKADTKYLDGGVKLAANCPSPIQVSVLGESLSFSYQPLCDFAKYLHPLIISLSWVIAAFTVGRGIGNL
ncbi:virulence factor TspB C-terminal domain-related protein, partial [Photobacterium rosenbergii]|uniref:virulence factor TspB C-terminal domain-related protein n=1 Tax=Photobacterium rosenbergii TaxID=294936 RepID=UPI001C9A0AE9